MGHYMKLKVYALFLMYSVRHSNFWCGMVLKSIFNLYELCVALLLQLM